MRVWKPMGCLGSLIGLIAANLFSCPCRAMMRIPGRFPSAVSAVYPPIKDLNLYSASRDCSKGFDIGLVQPIESRSEMKSEDVSMIIPSDMRPGSNGGQVAARIVDRSLNTWFNSSAVQNSGIGKTAHSFEQSMNSDMSVGGSEPDSIKHSFKFNVRAAQTQALLKYEGLTNAQLSYQVAAAKLDLEVREPVSALSTDLVFNHTVVTNDSRDIFSVRWAW